MLEETLLDYALMRTFARKSPTERASLNPLCVQFWKTPDAWRRLLSDEA